MYQDINPEIEQKIETIIQGEYEFSVLGTIGKENYPFISKILQASLKFMDYIN